MAVFESKKSLKHNVINDTMSDDKVVTSDEPRGTSFQYILPALCCILEYLYLT